jgi:type 1 glutamine amidotransferase
MRDAARQRRQIHLSLAIVAGITGLLLGSRPAIPEAPSAPSLHVCLASASGEYKSDDSLKEFQKMLEVDLGMKCSRAFGKDGGKGLPGLDALDTADVLILFTRRVTLSDEELKQVKAFCAAGKGVIGIRTASHGIQNWKELDAEVFGGNYKGHYGNAPAQITVDDKGKNHPVLAGVNPFSTTGKLYKNPSLGPDVTLLLTAATEKNKEPVAWVRERNPGGRAFYTSLGVPEDFKDENFRRLLVNAIHWTARREPPKK